MIRPLLVGLSAVFFGACATTIRPSLLQPARVYLGSSRQLSILETTGRQGAKDAVVSELLDQLRSDGFFAASDRSTEGFTITVNGELATVVGKGRALKPGEVGLRIDVLDWGTERENLAARTNAKGEIIQQSRRGYLGKVLLGVTVFNPHGKAYLSEREFRGQPVEADSEEEAIRSALRFAVHLLVASITPSAVPHEIRMDGDDGHQKRTLELAKAGHIEDAVTELRLYVSENSTNQAALYNLAVLQCVQGHYRESMELFARAAKPKPKDFYEAMQKECAQRLADEQAADN